MRKGSGNSIPQALVSIFLPPSPALPFLSVFLSFLSAQLIAELHVDVEEALFSVRENTLADVWF